VLTFEQPWLLLLLLPVGLLVFLTWRQMALPFPVHQRRLILVSRLLLFTLIIAALAGTAISLPVSHQSLVFVGDISASTETQRTFIEQWINDAIRHKHTEDQVGIVAVGRNALVEQAVHAQIDFSHFDSAPDTNYTDLAAGLRLAAAILPSNTERHIILLSDGQQNLGDALQEAQLLQQQGIRLDIVNLPSSHHDEALISNLSAPTTLRTNERFTLHATVNSTVAQNVILRVYLDQSLLEQSTVHLVVGENQVTFDLVAPSAGFHSLHVRLDAAKDTLLQNNDAAAYLNVQGPPQVLVIEGHPGSGQNIVNALKATKIATVVEGPNDLPTSLDGLAPYGAVVLADVPAVALGTARMQTLQAFVRDLGHGLVVSGGQNSYGIGGYSDTPLEQTLPVSMNIPQHKETPDIAVILIVESLESNISVNISKEAAKGVVSLLNPQDQVGISAAYGTLVVPMQHVTNKAAINKAIDAMDPADPNSYRPDLQNAEQVLLHTTAKIKHVILLGDGDAFDTGYQAQVVKMANENITVSTVETNAANLQEMNTMVNIASWGRGRFYRADDPGVIPQVLLKETEQASRRTIINDSFNPIIVGSHQLMSGLNALPTLDGYVATTPKPNAQMVLISTRDDPVLAAWQYGLGRAVAWTSDALGLWTSHWLTWKEAARWWANLVTWSLPSPDSAMNINGQVVNGVGQLSVDIPAGTVQTSGNQQQVQAHIVAPDHSQQTVTLQATAPQHWTASFPATQVGSYLLQVTWQNTAKNGAGGTNRLTATSGMVVPYSPEYHTQGTDAQFLSQLARAGGGNVLPAGDSARAFDQNLQPVTTTWPLAFLFLILAALLLPVDIAARRLSSLEFLSTGYSWLLKRLYRGQRQTSSSQPGDNALGISLTSLRSLRQTIQEQSQQTERVSTSRTATVPRPDVKVQTTTAPVKKPVEATKGAASEQRESKTTMAERLLEAKRKRGESKDS
jgi:uncharacterized membrane protein